MIITGEPLPLKKEFSVNLPVASPAFRIAALVPEEMRPNRPHEPPKQPAPSRTAEGPACLLPPAQPLRGWENRIKTRRRSGPVSAELPLALSMVLPFQSVLTTLQTGTR